MGSLLSTSHATTWAKALIIYTRHAFLPRSVPFTRKKDNGLAHMQVQVKYLTKLPKTTENGIFRALLLRVLLLPGL